MANEREIIIELIELYRDLPCLWDMSCQAYKDTIQKKCLGNFNFKAPVHVVTGSAGCQEGRDRFYHNPYSWSAFRSQDYGYTRFEAHNRTHLYMEQVSADLKGQVIDSFWLVKTKLSFDMH